ncbi:MAG TPA: Nudix family hydrolase [Xanthomonadaceae bacterium]|nr:Nudix family hydrolase [Xanthomonadaceae bacterium]
MSAKTPIHVVAAVIEDARGRILLTRRTRVRDLAGLWEFPGGKVDPGEAPEHALARELHEELGIEFSSCEPLIRVPHAYDHKRIVLDVYRVTGVRGVPRSRERQALAWSPPHRLSRYPMPGADRPVVAALCLPAHYAITAEPDRDDPDAWLTDVAACADALAGGDVLLQLRIKSLPDAERRRLIEAAVETQAPHRELILINADVSLAQRLRCGVHLTAAQLAAAQGRPLPATRLVAAACHDANELATAEALRLDFAVLSPVAATPSHPDAPVLGWTGFAAARERTTLPVYALGGLTRAQLPEARQHGAQGIAGIRGFAPRSLREKG